MPRTATLDAARIFETLHRHGVEYIVIGGLAAAAGGVVWTTFDADVVVESSANNLDALSRALDELSAEYDTLHSPPIRPTRSGCGLCLDPSSSERCRGDSTCSKRPAATRSNPSRRLRTRPTSTAYPCVTQVSRRCFE